MKKSVWFFSIMVFLFFSSVAPASENGGIPRYHSILIPERAVLEQISKICNLNQDEILRLNPGFTKHNIIAGKNMTIPLHPPAYLSQLESELGGVKKDKEGLKEELKNTNEELLRERSKNIAWPVGTGLFFLSTLYYRFRFRSLNAKGPKKYYVNHLVR